MKKIGPILFTTYHYFAFIVMLFSYSLQAQVEEQVKDSVKTGIDFGKIEIPNPKSILDTPIYPSVFGSICSERCNQYITAFL